MQYLTDFQNTSAMMKKITSVWNLNSNCSNGQIDARPEMHYLSTHPSGREY